MAAELSATYGARLQSWVESANGHPDFPIQNLPFGVFSPPGGKKRGGVAIGNEILDTGAAHEAGLFSGEAARAAEAASQPTLNALLALGSGPRGALRARLSALLDANGAERSRLEGIRARLLHQAADCTLHLPAQVSPDPDPNSPTPVLLTADDSARALVAMCATRCVHEGRFQQIGDLRIW